MKPFSFAQQKIIVMAALMWLVVEVAGLTLHGDEVLRLPAAPSARRHPLSAKSMALETPVNPNFASYERLLAIPGIGPVTARNILLHRERHIFFSPRDMLAVRGIGPKRWAKLKQYFDFAAGAGQPSESGGR